MIRILASSLTICIAAAGKVTPTQQVVNMLVEIKAKGEKMMHEEQKVYSAYAQWVEDEVRQLGFQIVDATKSIEGLSADIGKGESDANELGSEISTLEAEIQKLSGAKAEATSDRGTEHAEYLKTAEDYTESVSALERAIQVLKSQNYDRSQAEMLLQRMSKDVPGMTRVMSAFLQEKGRASRRGDGAPAVAAYEFQSSDIVEMLEGLHDKFKSELSDVEESESNSAHAYNLMELHLSNTIKRDTSDRDDKVVSKGKRLAAVARAKGELSETTAAKAADEQLSKDTQATFKAKAATYEENQQVRTAELEAVAKAIEIISDSAVSGSYAKHLSLAGVAPAPKATAFLLLRRSSRRIFTKQRIVELLAKHARALGSKELASLAQAVEANPFEKVIGMIEDMIAQLKEAAVVEAEHKTWCDAQLKDNKLKRNAKTAEVDRLVAEIEGMEASIADMGSTIQELTEEQADLTKKMAEATELRKAEKTENLATISDAKSGFDAVGQALVVLKEFYAGQASFLQQVPEMAAYKGQQEGNKGVLGMLAVIQTDFARLRADTEAAESAAATEYEKLMEESEASKKAKHEKEVKLRLDKDQTEYENGVAKKDLNAVNEELAHANEYYEQLKPSCLEVHVSWDERVAKRKEEIAALKEAYTILDQKSVE